MTTVKKTTPPADESQTEGQAKAPDAGQDAGQAEVQAAVDEAAEKGYYGERTDKTPLENYTLAGVAADKPTPETTRGESTPETTRGESDK